MTTGEYGTKQDLRSGPRETAPAWAASRLWATNLWPRGRLGLFTLHLAQHRLPSTNTWTAYVPQCRKSSVFFSLYGFWSCQHTFTRNNTWTACYRVTQSSALRVRVLRLTFVLLDQCTYCWHFASCCSRPYMIWKCSVPTKKKSAQWKWDNSEWNVMETLHSLSLRQLFDRRAQYARRLSLWQSPYKTAWWDEASNLEPAKYAHQFCSIGRCAPC